LETFTDLKELTDNPDYEKQKYKALLGLTDDMIDPPIVSIINGFNKLPYCFTLQSCFGHFIYDRQEDPHCIKPLPVSGDFGGIDRVQYRIAYIAFCIENSFSGRELLKSLKQVLSIDSENIQLGCAEWFQERQVNSYVVQVEPDRFKYKDYAEIDFKEALQIENVRNEFFARLFKFLENIGQ
jgi:hypothetical protein